MLNTIFLIAAVVGGTVIVCQFALTLIGMDHDVSDGSADVHVGGDFHGDHVGGGDVHGGDVLTGDGSGHPGLGGSHHGASSDGLAPHPDSSWLFGVLSFRTLVAATAFFGIGGRAAMSAGFRESTSLVIAAAAGLAAMYGTFWLMQTVSALTSSGIERIANALGRRGTVYVPIPAEGRGAGKVQLSMQNRIVELEAVTDEAERLRTGEAVIVTAVAGSGRVRVRRVEAAVAQA
jgi:hypothetical protein